MANNLALVFPGQGSQYVGMGKALSGDFAAAKNTFAEADDALDFPLSQLCFAGPEEDLKLTENTQPAILATSVAGFRVLQAETPLRPMLVAGHSLGEYSALVAAGAIEFREAVRIVRERGRLMQQAVPNGEGAMAVVLGLDMDATLALCAEASGDEIVAPANFNGGGQIVIAGTKRAVKRAMVLARKRGAKRVLDLPVSAPFHCPLMKPAAEGLEALLRDVPVQSLKIGVVTNVEAEVNWSADRVKALLVEQAIRPVRWEQSVRKLDELGVRQIIEVGPGKVLKNLIKRIEPAMTVENFEMSEDLAKVLAVMQS
ncbi:MAG TPA: ACP S-malonyltransferase [Candidatus Binatia bacterium]|nr:ACP S-malonyltransferase [Candidatus Binatia bacterium]